MPLSSEHRNWSPLVLGAFYKRSNFFLKQHLQMQIQWRTLVNHNCGKYFGTIKDYYPWCHVWRTTYFRQKWKIFFSDFEREDVLETDILSGKRMPNSFSTTIETTTYRGHQLMDETPGTSSNMRAALRGVEFIAQHIKNQDKDNEVSLFEKFYMSGCFFVEELCTLLIYLMIPK